jgi:macrolide transport system ATP-binding/permease protein
MNQLQFSHIDFEYDGIAVFEDLSFAVDSGWTGVVGANGSGKSTLLRLATGLLEPSAGHVTAAVGALLCEQRTDAPPADLRELLSAADADAGRLCSLLGIQPEWPEEWGRLSHGERKRAQIGVALWRSPPVLAVDEPTNHLDSDARALLQRALSEYSGVGLLVSHDRELLDSLCHQCLFLERPSRLRPGGVTTGMAEAERERREAERLHREATREAGRVVAEVHRREAEAAKAAKRRSKRTLARKDSDAREKIDRARISGQDGKRGRLKRQLDGRLEQATERAAAAAAPVRRKLGVTVHAVASRSDAVVRFGPATLPLGPNRALRVGELEITPRERIGVVGQNGCGKSTLIRAVVAASEAHRVLYIPQEITACEATAVVESARQVQPARLGRLMSTISRLGSDPERLLATALPSPGELRKLMLALGLEQEPELIVMDEPTNHLDFPSIELVEDALAAADGALLLVSHDHRFLDALTCTRWRLDRESDVSSAGGHDSTLTVLRGNG